MTEPRWLLIAEFARRCRLPVSTLRYYDRVGLLRPTATDPHTGYRRYSLEQLPTASVIAGLRAIGTAPAVIARILSGGSIGESAIGAERRRITEEIAERTDALGRLAELTKAGPPNLGGAQRVELVGAQVPALRFVCDATDLTSTITRGIARLRAALRRHQAPAAGWGTLLPLDLGDRVTGHVFARHVVARTDLDRTDLEILTLPRGNAVQITHDGAYHHLANAYHVALTEIDCCGARPRAPVIEDYPSTEQRSVRLTVLMDRPA